jgi:hypothetical protein
MVAVVGGSDVHDVDFVSLGDGSVGIDRTSCLQLVDE